MIFKSNKLLFFISLVLVSYSLFAVIPTATQNGVTKTKTNTEISYEGYADNKLYKCLYYRDDKDYACIQKKPAAKHLIQHAGYEAQGLFNKLKDQFNGSEEFVESTPGE